MTTTSERTAGAEDVAWNLDDLYADESALDAELAEARGAAEAFRERHRGRVAVLSGTELHDAVAELERIEALTVRAHTYAYLRFATATDDPVASALLQRAQEAEAAKDTQLVFFRLEWSALEDEAAEALLAEPALGRYRHWLEALRRYRPYLLSEPEERILTEKAVSGSTAWTRLYNELLGALKVRLDGEERSLEEALARLQQADRDVRRQAAEAITEALQPGLRTRAFVLNTLLLDKATDDRLRGYPHWLAARNLANEVSDEAVEALVQAVVSRYDIPQRYYRLKAKLLGLPKLADYDRMAPVSQTTTHTPWQDAAATVLGAYRDFHPEVGRAIRRFFDESWIDAPVRESKMLGAFCATRVPGAHPYVLMNYTGDRRSVLTLAHELGHGLHGLLAAEQGPLNAETPLTLAETASVFGEALTFRRLAAGEEDPRRRLDLLTGRLEDAIATTFRQIALNRFEHALHTTRREGGELSSDRIGELFVEAQAAMLGDAVELSDGYATWWSYVPHFLSAGYVYAYAYGYLFSLAIFHRYEREGEAIVEPYLDVLRAGGSRPPEELARIVGLDVSDAALWHEGLAAIDDVLGEAERLADSFGV